MVVVVVVVVVVVMFWFLLSASGPCESSPRHFGGPVRQLLRVLVWGVDENTRHTGRQVQFGPVWSAQGRDRGHS